MTHIKTSANLQLVLLMETIVSGCFFLNVLRSKKPVKIILRNLNNFINLKYDVNYRYPTHRKFWFKREFYMKSGQDII